MQVLAVRENAVVEAPTNAATDLMLARTDNPIGGDRPDIDEWLGRDSGPSRCIAWSGTLADGLYGKEPMTWLAPGAAAFRLCCDGIEERLNATSKRLLFRPHCRHVLSDPPSCVTFAESRADGPFGLALCPASLFETDMLADSGDHLRRIFTTVGPLCEAVILVDVSPPESGADPDALPVATPIGQGAFDKALLRSLIERHCMPGTPVIFGIGDAGEQASLLGLA